MNVLVMGGTRFNGLALVHELVKHGHEVTIFNRGQTEAAIPRGVRRLLGDRKTTPAWPRSSPPSSSTASTTSPPTRPTTCAAWSRSSAAAPPTTSSPAPRSSTPPARCCRSPSTTPSTRSERQGQYGLDKLECEAILLHEHRSNGFPATIVPFSMVFGPNNIIPEREQRMFSRLLAGRPVLIPATAARSARSATSTTRRAGCACSCNSPDLRQALQPHRPRLLERRGLRRHLRRSRRRRGAQGLRPSRGHGPALRRRADDGRRAGRQLRQHPYRQQRQHGGGGQPRLPPAGDSAPRAVPPPLEPERRLQHRAPPLRHRLRARVHLRGRRRPPPTSGTAAKPSTRPASSTSVGRTPCYSI